MRRPPGPPRSGFTAEDACLTAWRLLEQGEFDAAREAAGRAVYLDAALADGYLALGEAALGLGEPREALEAFSVARRKARRNPVEELASVQTQQALSGMAKSHLLAGAYEQAIGPLRELVENGRPEDRGSAGQLLAEVHLVLGHPDAAKSALESVPHGPDRDLVSALVALEVGDLGAAVDGVRFALLHNVYLLACLLEEEPPDHGIVHGTAESSPEFAQDVAERLRPFLEVRTECLDTVVRIATTPTVMGEVSELVGLALSLNQESDPALRESLVERISWLRDPDRIGETRARVIEESQGP